MRLVFPPLLCNYTKPMFKVSIHNFLSAEQTNVMSCGTCLKAIRVFFKVTTCSGLVVKLLIAN